MEFYYDPTKREAERVQARRYTCTVDENGVITVGPRTQAVVSNDVIKDRLSRLMDQLIIVGDVEDGHEYYKSKGGTLLRVTKTSDGRLAFIKMPSLTYIPANTAYLQVSVGSPDVIYVVKEIPDGIESVKVADVKPQTGVYSLSGQRVADRTEGLQKGVYIVNGRKFTPLIRST